MKFGLCVLACLSVMGCGDDGQGRAPDQGGAPASVSVQPVEGADRDSAPQAASTAASSSGVSDSATLNATHAATGPNLLLVTLDTMRADRLGCYGYEAARTPVIDALAARGVLFEQAFTPAPMTLPAHTTMMTGMAPPQHGARVNGEHKLADGLPTLASVLSERGYGTGAFVAAFVLDGKFGLDQGFDHYGDDLSLAYEQEVPESLSAYRPGATVVDEALEWLGTSADSKPFFAWVHLYDAHYPWHAHEDDEDGADGEPGSYDGEVAYLDRQVGRLLSALEERGDLEDTVVMVVADHGEGLGDHHEIEHGYLLNEEVLHVPWIMAGPGITRGHRAPALVSLEDLAPTALALLHQPALTEPTLLGRSLSPALQGEPMRPGLSYAETDLPWTAYHWAPQRSLTTADWKYVSTPQAELYDRNADRGELVNLIEVRPQMREKMQTRLAGLQDQMGERLSEAALLTAEEAESLAALGYVGGSGGADSPADREDLSDVKQRLAAKDLSATLRQREAAGDLSAQERLELMAELVALSPETPSFHAQLGSAWIELGNIEEGVGQLAMAVELAPGSASLHYELGDVLQSQGYTVGARREFEATLALAPDMAAAHVGMGNVLRAEGRSDLAAGRYTEAIRLRPGYAEAHFNLAQTFRDRGVLDRAIEQLRLAAEHRPEWVLPHSVLAVVLQDAGRPDEAVSEHEAAIELLPGDAGLHNDLGLLLESMGRSDGARAHYSQAVDLAPLNYHTRILMADQALAAGDDDAALAALEEALRLAPDVAEPAARLARFLAACTDETLRDGARAVSLAEHAVDLTGGQHARVLDTMGMAYAAAGRFGEALSAAQRGQALALQEGDLTLSSEMEGRLELFALQAGLEDSAGPAQGSGDNEG